MTWRTAPPTDAPNGLADTLADRGASVAMLWREGRRAYLTAESPDGPLFARYSNDPDDVVVLEHEAAVRRLVGSDGPLRTPPVLDAGPGWMLEVRKEAGPVAGAESVDAVLAAVAALSRHTLPAAQVAGGRKRFARATLSRRARVALSSLHMRDVARARAIVELSPLPRVTSHGDLHTGNVLISDGAAWVVDWELSGLRPVGFDLMQLWATLPDPSDRDRLWEGALATIDEEHHEALADLRYALTVRTIANKLAAPHHFDRDSEGGGRLLALLPSIRLSLTAEWMLYALG